jgi:hypothetical protein
MGKALLVIGVILIIVVLVGVAIYRTQRWRDRQILKRNPLALHAKGLNRDVLLELADQQEANTQLRQTLSNVAGLLEQALGDDVVTMWGVETRKSVERALSVARKSTKELE